MFKRIDLVLLLIVVLATFFRLYNFQQLQYWNTDDELLSAVMRHIIWDRSPILLVPDLFLEVGFGPYFVWFLAPFYIIFNFDLVSVRAVASLLGVVCTYLVYLCGKELLGKTAGYLGGFLYASSFFVSFVERRLWFLTLNTFETALALWVILKVINKNYQYIPLLGVVMGLALHADPSLLIVWVVIPVCLVIFKVPVFTKRTVYAFLLFLLFLLPFAVAEINYDRSVSKSYSNAVGTFSNKFGERPKADVEFFNFGNLLETYARVIYLSPSSSMEEQVSSATYNYPKHAFSPFLQIILLLSSVYCLYLIIIKKLKPQTLSLFIFLLSFSFGLLILNFVLGGSTSQNYYSVIFPVFILIIALNLSVVYKNFAKLVYFILFLYLVFNLNTLIKSTVSYPISKKVELVARTSELVGNSDINLESNRGVEGGWTELFITGGKAPVKSDWYDLIDWTYAAYSLYPPRFGINEPIKNVTIKDKDDADTFPAEYDSLIKYKDVRIFIK